jgi:oligopeptidase B
VDQLNPPIAKKIEKTFEIHGDVRQDPYYWMNEKTNPEVIEHLEAENTYYKETLAQHSDVIEDIYEQLIARIPAEETAIEVKRGDYFYYAREEKDLQYPILARKKAATRAELATAVEEILLDQNTLAGDDDYLTIYYTRMSPDHTHLAYLENRDGSDSYTAYVKNIATGELLPDVIPSIYIDASLEWSACGNYLFYVTLNDMQRPNKLWRHKIGTAVTEDVLLFEEEDVTFFLYISKSQSGQYLFTTSHSTTTSECHYIDLTDATNELQLFAKRVTNVDYGIEHLGDEFILLTNEDAVNFQLIACKVNDLSTKRALVPYDEAFYIQNIVPFKNHLYVTGRANGLEQIWYVENGQLVQLTWDEPIYSVHLLDGQDFDADEILVNYLSYVTPKTTFAIDATTNEKTIIKQEEVTGAFDPSLFTQEQVWVTAQDGVKVSVLLQYKKGALDNGPAPLILSAYGAYGYSSDPFFSEYRLPILEKGVVFATAQVRGGSELGRTWYYDGKMANKMNTFTDFIAAADYLIDNGYTTSEQLVGRGGSAGGLLIGAVSNLAGTKFKVLVPEVPFVDVLTTMLDETIPLTTAEWDEWGNPKIEEQYGWMRAYSPYDNVEAKDYPHLFVTTGLNDPRVGYFEPAKWVARLREMKTDSNTLVFKTNMGAGHYGASGRKNQLRETAEYYGFVLTKIGVK